MKNIAIRGAAACLLACLSAGVTAASCNRDETLVGEDRDYLYCMKTREISDCRSKGGDIGKCINAGCVRTAGLQLRDTLAECKEKNAMCLHERGAPAGVVESISGCIAGAVVANVGGCFVGTFSGAIKYDTAVNICKAQFGNCVEPGLKEHKSFVQACERYRK